MFGAVNAAVVRPRPSLPWQVAQPPPIMPPPAALPLRGMTAPLASRPVWKMTSPRETEDPVAAGAAVVPPLCREAPTMSTPATASSATTRATPAITRLPLRPPAMSEIVQLLEILVPVDLPGCIPALEDVLGRLRPARGCRRDCRRGRRAAGPAQGAKEEDDCQKHGNGGDKEGASITQPPPEPQLPLPSHIMLETP